VRPVKESGKTFKQNAIKKAVLPSRQADALVIGEDSGLVVAALKGAPGIRSARYSGAQNQMGRDPANNLKLLRALERVPPSRRKAMFVCTAAIAYRGKLLGTVRGVVHGSIALKAHGHRGFGYDPLFIPKGYQSTFGELGAAVKDRLSHRAQALRRAKPLIVKALKSAKSGRI